MCVQGTAALLRKLDEGGTQEAFDELVDYMREQVSICQQPACIVAGFALACIADACTPERW